jgi:hypothetical protein
MALTDAAAMHQIAPRPEELARLVDELAYKPRWEITLADVDRGQGSIGLTLCVLITTPNAYNHDQQRRVMHYMPVPPAAYNRDSWQRWLLEQLLAVERHEACEFFTVAGVKPFAPNHGPGHDPYTVVQLTTDEDRRTQFTGEVKP